MGSWGRSPLAQQVGQFLQAGEGTEHRLAGGRRKLLESRLQEAGPSVSKLPVPAMTLGGRLDHDRPSVTGIHPSGNHSSRGHSGEHPGEHRGVQALGLRKC